MVKRRKRKPFNEPSRTVEKYYERIASANPAATTESEDSVVAADIDATDAPQPDEVSEKPAKKIKKGRRTKDKNQIFEFLKNPLTQTAIAIVIVLFGVICWGNGVSNSLNNISRDITRIDSQNGAFVNDAKDRFQNIQLVLTEMTEKFQRMFDRLNDVYYQKNLAAALPADRPDVNKKI